VTRSPQGRNDYAEELGEDAVQQPKTAEGGPHTVQRRQANNETTEAPANTTTSAASTEHSVAPTTTVAPHKTTIGPTHEPTVTPVPGPKVDPKTKCFPEGKYCMQRALTLHYEGCISHRDVGK